MNVIKTALLPLVLGTLFYSSVSNALEDDNEQPIYIDSDTASYDEKNDISIYTGNVIYTQGSLVIHSDQMTFHLKDGEIVKVVAVGKPARLKQSQGKGKEDIRGVGLTGEYYPATSKLHLIKQAEVWQGGKKTKSDLIIYDTKYSVLTAGDKSSGSKRVHSIFQPASKK
ncbi:MAG: lipopolysaccharide transport periplasmic protein LptA [Methylococcaceae bacterium]|nr:lipopolysaccharide transport periplasmic protein LptA [Methylococcaceae bacterium]